MFNNFSFPPESHAIRDNVEKYDTASQAPDDNVKRHVHIACWITKATDTHLEYVILFTFPHQQWFLECTSMLRTLPVLYKS